jgi:hypothetical protein
MLRIDQKSSKCASKAGDPECRAFDRYGKRQYKTQEETEYRVSAVDETDWEKSNDETLKESLGPQSYTSQPVERTTIKRARFDHSNGMRKILLEIVARVVQRWRELKCDRKPRQGQCCRPLQR